ncbi:hypothetical protein J2S69_002343 [Glycomyces lechevalierae]|jgi:hypothetical protein|uniref:Photosystem II reaction center protein T n=1 Tax=Glycomyces lechevalierae TaxID=256034 RepID=A0ABU2AN29_9ACTN|nr:hypothetical protein [Glycomyces lechevalierae]
MNEFLEISMVVSLVLTLAFLIAGTALPFLPQERKVRR